MKLQAALVAPWRLLPRSQSGLMLVLFGACTVGAIAVGRADGNPHWWALSAALYCLGIGFSWAFHMPCLLPVAMTARRLSLPGVTQTMASSVVLYAALCVAAPVVVLAPLGANGWMVALAAALTVTVGLAFALLPRYAMFALYLLCFALPGIANLLHMPSLNKPDHAMLLGCGSVILLVLLAVDITRWRALLHGQIDGNTRLRGALVMQFVQFGMLGHGAKSSKLDTTLIRQIPDWAQACADLRDVDRAHPARAIRVAVGRQTMPLSLRSRARQWAVATPIIAIGLVEMFVGDASLHAGNALFHSAWLGWLLAGFLVIALPSAQLLAVQRRWHGANASLALLALLPGLGTPAVQKRHAISAALLQPCSWLLGALLACWLVVFAIHAPTALAGYALLVVLGTTAILGMGVFGSLGGHPLGNFSLGALFVAFLSLIGLTPFADRVSDVFFLQPPAASATTHAWLAAYWLAWFFVAVALNLRGWHALQRRPHPFLANER